MTDIESIDISRFNEKCSICLKTGYGPCLKCENNKCKVFFHVECARINKFHMECLYSEDGLKYFLYCQSHRPLQFLKSIEIKNNKKKEDIMKFGEILEKQYESLQKQNPRFNLITKTFPLEKSSSLHLKFLNKKRNKQNNQCNNNQYNNFELTKIQQAKIISKVKEIYHKASNIDIIIKYKEKSKKYEVLRESNNFITYKDTFDKDVFPWYLVNIPGIPIKVAYQTYGKIISNLNEFNNYIFYRTTPGVNTKNNNLPINTATNKYILNKSSCDYCFCKKSYDESFMIECSNTTCEHNRWFHPQCVEELKNVTKEEMEKDEFEFTCRSCRRKYDENYTIENTSCYLNNEISTKRRRQTNLSGINSKTDNNIDTIEKNINNSGIIKQINRNKDDEDDEDEIINTETFDINIPEKSTGKRESNTTNENFSNISKFKNTSVNISNQVSHNSKEIILEKFDNKNSNSLNENTNLIECHDDKIVIPKFKLIIENENNKKDLGIRENQNIISNLSNLPLKE